MERAKQTATTQNPATKNHPEPSRRSDDAGHQTQQIGGTADASEKEAQAKTPSAEEAGSPQEDTGSEQVQAVSSGKQEMERNGITEENTPQQTLTETGGQDCPAALDQEPSAATEEAKATQPPERSVGEEERQEDSGAVQAADGEEPMEVETQQPEAAATSAKTTQETTDGEKATASDTATSQAGPVQRAISYYEWRTMHHKWLNALMRKSLGEKDAPEPPLMTNLRYPVRPDPDHHVDLEPS